MKQCRVCGVELDNENWTLSYQKISNCICKECKRKYEHKRFIENRNIDKNGNVIIKNKESGTYLGIIIAERLLLNVFNNVIQMPINNKGFDFICNKGFKIDVKSSCRRVAKKQSDRWGVWN